MLCNYTYQIIQPTIFFTHIDSPIEVDVEDILQSGCSHMILDSVGAADVPFVQTLMKICGDQIYLNFAVMDIQKNKEVAMFLYSFSKEYFTFDWSRLVFSIRCAITSELSKDAFVGAYWQEDGAICFQPINSRKLKYSSFESIIPYAEKLAEEITLLNLSDLEKIIWIDNWFQDNIQYIKNREFVAGGKKYICEQIKKEATVPDVFLKHYGTCEDIATSIAAVLNKLDIPCEEVQVREKDGAHAWLLVKLNQQYYIWDCTHNITRNPYVAPNGLKATRYSSEFTLLGTDKNNGKYETLTVMPVISDTSYPLEEIENAIEHLKQKGVKFTYSKFAEYDSLVQENTSSE